MTETATSSDGFINPAKLLDLDTGIEYDLPEEEGVYSIGRKDDKSNADIQIETKDNYMHRVHVKIKVQKKDNRYYYGIGLSENANNPIIIDGRIITNTAKNETIPLEKNQVIRLPFVKLRIIEKERM